MTDADYRARVRFGQMLRDGDFDLGRTPPYMRERAARRAAQRAKAAQDGPGYRWLLGVVPAMLLVAAVMAALILYM